MNHFKYVIAIAITCVALGLLIVFIPQPSGTSVDEINLDNFSRAELAKRMETSRIDTVRYIADKRYEEAMMMIIWLIDLNHHDQFSYSQMARIFNSIGEESFLGVFSRAVKKSPIPVLDTDRSLGAVYFIAGKNEKAQTHINRFLKENPNDLAATFYLGSIKRVAGDYDSAIPLLNSVIEREETYYFAYIELQTAYESMGNKEMSAKMAELALEKSLLGDGAICHGLPDEKKS